MILHLPVTGHSCFTGGSPGAPVAPSSPSSAPVSGPSADPTEPESTSGSGGEDGRSITPNPPEPEENDTGTNPETEDEKALRLLYCSLCKVAVNSASQLDAHNSGEERLALSISRIYQDQFLLSGRNHVSSIFHHFYKCL